MRKTKWQTIKEVKEEIEVFALRLQELQTQLPKSTTKDLDLQFTMGYNILSGIAADLYTQQQLLDLKHRRSHE